MTWFKGDDSFPTHPKVLRIPRADRVAAVGLWWMAGAWCAKHLTDGHLEAHMVDELAGSERSAELLVQVGLWEKTDTGYVFHDWTDWQPTRAEVEEQRRREREKKANARAKRAAMSPQLSLELSPGDSLGDTSGDDPGDGPGESSGDTDGNPDGVPGGVRSTRPVPSRPDHSPNGESGPRKRGTRVPEDFVPSDDDRDKARQLGFSLADLDRITVSFIDYWRGVPGQKGVKLDWPATWRNWVRKEAERRPVTRHLRPVASASGRGPGVKPWEL